MTSQPPHGSTHDPERDPSRGLTVAAAPSAWPAWDPWFVPPVWGLFAGLACASFALSPHAPARWLLVGTLMVAFLLFQLRVVPGYRARTRGPDPRAHRRADGDRGAHDRTIQIHDAKASSAQTSRGRGSGAPVAARIQYLVAIVGMDVVRELRIAHQPRGTITAVCVGVAAGVSLLGIYGRRGSVDPR